MAKAKKREDLFENKRFLKRLEEIVERAVEKKLTKGEPARDSNTSDPLREFLAREVRRHIEVVAPKRK
jgi:hypothetical protein